MGGLAEGGDCLFWLAVIWVVLLFYFPAPVRNDRHGRNLRKGEQRRRLPVRRFRRDGAWPVS